MSDLKKEIGAIVNSIIPSKAEYILRKSYSGSIHMDRTGRPESSYASPFTMDVLQGVSEVLDWASMKHIIASRSRDEVTSNIRSTMVYNILDFILINAGTKNNRLTTVYRWYGSFLTNHRLNANDRFENDMFAIYKHIIVLGQTPIQDIAAKKAIVGVLDAMRQRYEASDGWKL